MVTRIYLWLSITVIVIFTSIGVISFVPPAWGIDFIGGSLLEITAPEDSLAAVRETLATFEVAPTVQTTQGGTILVKMQPIDEATHQAIVESLTTAGLLQEELRFETIGPTIGAELRRKAWIAVSLTLVTIIAYLAYTFRETAGLVRSWKFGVAAVVALVHDILFVTAVFMLAGYWWGATIDTLFVSALLAILGYSVNDTIVLFNRTKDEWRRTRSANLLDLIDRATQASIIRSLNTSLTTLLVLVALFVWGGTTIHWFIFALLIGTVVGTYSSLFVAPPLLYVLARRR